MSVAPLPAIDPRLPAEAKVLTRSSVWRKAFSFPVFLGALLVAGVFALHFQEVLSLPPGLADSATFEGDTWYHILEGEEILQTHTWPTKDTYSFTAHGGDSMAFEWLGQIAWALVDRLGGPRALAALLIFLGAALMLLLYGYTYLRCKNALAAFLVCAGLLPLAAMFFSLRPQLLGYIFLLLTLICLELFRQGPSKALWVLPPLFLIWVNTHGSFILGLVVLAVHWASGLAPFRAGSLEAVPWTDGQRRQLLTIILLCVLALTITPYGTTLAGFTFHVILNAPLGMAHIVEYQPLGSYAVFKNFLGLLGLFLAGAIAVRPAYRLGEVVLLLLAICGACVHTRLLLLFVLVFAPMLAVVLDRWMPRREPLPGDRCLLNAALMLLLCAAIVKFFPSQQVLEDVIARGFPAGAANYLRQHPIQGAMYNSDFWGAYLIRSLGPGHKIFIDGRSQLYEENGVFEDYLRIIGLDRQTPALLRKYGIQACLVERNAPLATFLLSHPDWSLVYEDQLSTIFVRKNQPQRSAFRDQQTAAELAKPATELKRPPAASSQS